MEQLSIDEGENWPTWHFFFELMSPLNDIILKGGGEEKGKWWSILLWILCEVSFESFNIYLLFWLLLLLLLFFLLFLSLHLINLQGSNIQQHDSKEVATNDNKQTNSKRQSGKQRCSKVIFPLCAIKVTNFIIVKKNHAQITLWNRNIKLSFSWTRLLYPNIKTEI